MKKKTMTFMTALFLIAGGANAQSGIPTTYLFLVNNLLFIDLICKQELSNIGDNIIMEKPDMELGLVTPGVKKVITECNNSEDYGPQKLEHELYPNGLLRSSTNSNGKKNTYYYDKQWRIQNIVDNEGEIVYKYFYNQQHRLSKCLFRGRTHSYTYTADNQLKQILDDGGDYFQVVYKFKDNQLIEINSKHENIKVYPKTFSYDEKGRWKSFINIYEDGMDDIDTYRDQLAFTYNGTSQFPSSITWKSGTYNPTRKTYVGETWGETCTCTYTLDAKGNWTTWKLTGKNKTVTITRTITYYTDEEVKTAVAELEKARSGAMQNEQKKEDYWEF